MSEQGSLLSNQIADCFYAATHSFDHLTNLALHLNRIDKGLDLFDEPCTMDMVNDSVKRFAQGLDNAPKLRHSTVMKPYSAQPRRPSVPLTNRPMNNTLSDLNRSISKPASYRLLPANGLNSLHNGSLMRSNPMNVQRKRPMEGNSFVPSKQVRGIKWVSVDGNQNQSLYNRNPHQQVPKNNVRREYTVTPFRSNEPQRFLVKKELFQSQNVTAISLDDLKLKPSSNPAPLTSNLSLHQSINYPIRPKLNHQRNVPLTEEDAAVSSLLSTFKTTDSEMSGAE